MESQPQNPEFCNNRVKFSLIDNVINKFSHKMVDILVRIQIS